MRKYFGNKKNLRILIAMFILFLLSAKAQTEAASEKVRIVQTESDSKVIPDIYNTGAQGELTVVGLGESINGINFSVSGDGVTNVLDFYYRNKQAEGTIVFENMDFSNYPLALYNADKVERDIQLVFKNCKFSFVTYSRNRVKVKAEFQNCTFRRFTGSNATFDRCRFGEWYQDGMVPFQDVTVKNSYFYDFTSLSVDSGEIHIDGVQIYGAANLDVENILFDNCRFEVPYIRPQGSTAYVNACIMLQMEFSNAKNVTFSDCTVNGGGYCVYARAKKGEFILEDVLFSNIKFGCSSLYGKFYSDLSEAVVLENMTNTDSLYIGSVWKEKGKTYISVTNDTNQERKLTVYTDDGVFEYVIKACASGGELKELVDTGGTITYADMPFDMQIEIPRDCRYAICYDATIEGAAKQIRFVNWSGTDVYLEKELVDTLTGDMTGKLISGSCGDNVNYVLSKNGVLTLKGTGTTYDYHSQKPAPWAEYEDKVKEIIIEPGVERIGNQIFRSCTGVIKVTLPEGLKQIGGRAFTGCSCMTEIILPSSIESIGDAAFPGVTLKNVYYNGDDWEQVEIGKNNEDWSQKISAKKPESDDDKDSDADEDKDTNSDTNTESGFQLPKDAKKFASYQGYDFYLTNKDETYCADVNRKLVRNHFMCDGTYTYYFQYDGTAMKNRLTYHPDGVHVIYFDEYGHEVFSDFANVKKTIAGLDVDDYCFFDVFGYLYVDVVTYDKTGTCLYYANPYGVMDRGKWFEFSDTVKWADGTTFDKAGGKYGYANEDGTLMVNQWTYDWDGRECYMQGNGVALYP